MSKLRKSGVDDLASELTVPADEAVVSIPVRAAAVKLPVSKADIESQKIAESRRALAHPLSKGQKFFESPEGYILIGEEDRDVVWCRQANNGKGCNINPRR